MFIHLRTHSDYSLLKSTIKTKELVELAVQNKMPAIALTDNNNLSGSLEFSEHAIHHGIQPIIGCNVEVKHENQNTTLLLLVQNEIGYNNLLNILYDSSRQELSLSYFNEKTEGLIALTGEILSETLITSNDLIHQLISLFSNNLYIELQRVKNNQQRLEDELVKIAYNYNLPLIATNKVLFATKEDHEAHDALTCIDKGYYIDDINREKFTVEHYLKSQEEMENLFSDIPEAIMNTVTISKRCSFILEPQDPQLPKFPCEIHEDQEIKNEAYSGLKDRLENNIPENYQKRMEYELDIIIRMKYSGYFLIVSDFIKWSKKNDIPVGPGRGSGVGSIVAWALQITDLDPIKFNLIFERFLNPKRISMPDFDIDFCQKKRELVIRYIQQKYQHVAQIITFGNLQPRAVLRDVGRVLQIPYFQVDRICKMIPNNPVKPVTLPEAIELDTELQKERDNKEITKKLLSISLKLEGLHRHSSTHAAGIVISSKPLMGSIPISHDVESEIPVTQYSMKYVEKAGLVKFDFLGLKTLTIINDTCKILDNNLQINKISINDKNTFELLSNGDSVGVFQLENTFMRQTLKKLKPDSLEDIIALISLNRPGPMENIPTYISRKHGTEPIEYIHPQLEEVLKETFGVIIYQEQVMEIAKIIGGYTLGAADILRRAMGKKIKSEMDMQQDIFVKGAIENGIEKNKASHIFNLVAKFAGYGFNKSHAAAYALISYQTAYLKANYLVEFLTATMNLDIHDTDKLQLFSNEAKQHGIKILPPDINKSTPLFTVENGSIRYGLAAIKNVGLSALNTVCKKQYHSINDLINSALNKKTIESLAKAGAFDSIHNNRRQIHESAELISHAQIKNGQASLFGNMNIRLPEIQEWKNDEKLNREYEAIGFYLNAHPIDKYKKVLNEIRSQNIITGIVTKARMRSSKRGRFCILTLSHPDEIHDIAFYDHEIIEEKRHLFTVGQSVAINVTQGDNGVRGTSITTLDHFISSNLSNITIYVHNHDIIEDLPKIFSHRGNTTITLRVKSNNMEIDINLPHAYRININKIIEIDGIELL